MSYFGNKNKQLEMLYNILQNDLFIFLNIEGDDDNLLYNLSDT